MKKILIIDDDSRNLFALSAVLRSRGYTYAVAHTPHEGLQRLKDDNGIAVVLLDMMMPEMDGYTLLPHIRAAVGSALPVIAVTAQAMAGDREKCIAAGADDYLAKPINIDKLTDVLVRYIN